MKHLFAIVGIGLGIGTVASVLRTGDDIPDKQAASIPQKVRNDVQISLSDPLIPPKGGVTQGARHESYEVEVGKWLDQNIGIKKRIQSMRWYREFILQQISQNEFQKHLEHVLWIEEMLTKNPGTLEKVQYEGWWQKYLYGEILPERILRAYLKPSIQLEIFSREYPDIYHQTSQMSVWESGVQEGSDMVLIDRQMLLISMQRRMNSVKNTPNLQERLSKHGYNPTDFFSDDFRNNSGIYSVIEAITLLEDKGTFPGDARSLFFASERGKAYISGKLNPNDALKYMEEIVESIGNSGVSK